MNARRANWNEQIHTIERVRLTWRLLRDPRVAAWMKMALPFVAAIYLLMPIDLIPDVILGIGQVDDLSVMGIAIFAMTKLLPRLAPDAIVHEHLNAFRTRRGQREKVRGDVIDAAFTVVDRTPGDVRSRAERNSWENRG